MREFKNAQEIRELLISGSFEELKGAFENEFFEAKSEPWDLDSERGKFELAKDLSSLANSRGGIVVVGAAPDAVLTSQRNLIKEIHPLPISLAPDDRYSHILSEWIYPVPEGVEFRWYPLTADTDRGVDRDIRPGSKR